MQIPVSSMYFLKFILVFTVYFARYPVLASMFVSVSVCMCMAMKRNISQLIKTKFENKMSRFLVQLS